MSLSQNRYFVRQFFSVFPLRRHYERPTFNPIRIEHFRPCNRILIVTHTIHLLRWRSPLCSSDIMEKLAYVSVNTWTEIVLTYKNYKKLANCNILCKYNYVNFCLFRITTTTSISPSATKTNTALTLRVNHHHGFNKKVVRNVFYLEFLKWL